MDDEGGWKLFDENVCTITIYKQPSQDMFRVVSMNPSRKVFFFFAYSFVFVLYTLDELQIMPSTCHCTQSNNQ